jgi:putative membrane protein
MAKQPYGKLALAAALIALGTGLDAAAQSSTGTASGSSASTNKAATNSATANSAATNSGKAAARSSLASGERKFMEKAAMDGLAEVQMGQIAQQKAQNAQVKDFAGRMVTDHTKANEELKSLASAKGVQLPAEVDRSHKRHADELQKKSAEKFDREYMEHMVKEHKKDVKEFEKQAKGAKDPELKAFAQKTLPVLQSHLQAAQATYDATKGSRSSGKAGSASGNTGKSGSTTK